MGLRLPPRDGSRDFDPAPPYFLLACYLIVVLIVLAGLILINARGAWPDSSASKYQALVLTPDMMDRAPHDVSVAFSAYSEITGLPLGPGSRTGY